MPARPPPAIRGTRLDLVRLPRASSTAARARRALAHLQDALLGGTDLLAQRADLGLQRGDARVAGGDAQGERLAGQLRVACRRLGLVPQVFDPFAKLDQHVLEPRQVRLRGVEPGLGLLATTRQPGDAGGLRDVAQQRRRVGHEDARDLPLADHRDPGGPQAGPRQRLVDVEEAGHPAVEAQAAGAGTVEVAPHLDAAVLPSDSSTSTSAKPTPRLPSAPWKIRSVLVSARNSRARPPPVTHFSASSRFDLPEPLGPTTAVTPGENSTVVRFPNDLNPAASACVSRTWPRDRSARRERPQGGRRPDALQVVAHLELLVRRVESIVLEAHVEQDRCGAEHPLEVGDDRDRPPAAGVRDRRSQTGSSAPRPAHRGVLDRVSAGSPLPSTTTSTSTPSGATLQVASQVRDATSGSSSGTSRQLSLATPSAGMTVFLPAPMNPPPRPWTSSVGRAHSRSRRPSPASPGVAARRAAMNAARSNGTWARRARSSSPTSTTAS